METRKKWHSFLLVILWIVVGILLIRFLPLESWIHSLSVWIKSLGWWGVLAFIALYVVAALVMFPGSFITISAGAIFGFWKGLLVVSVASTLGATLAFLVARTWIRNPLLSHFSHSSRFRAMDTAIREEGVKIVLLIRLSPIIPYNIGNYLLGLTAVDLWPYVWATWLGMVPGTLLYVYAGWAGKSLLETGSPSVWALRIVGLLATLYITWLMARLARKHMPQSLNKS